MLIISESIEFIELFNMENNDSDNEIDDGNNLINTDVTLPMQLIHHIFDTYMGTAYKLLIHKEGSSDEDRSKVNSS